MRFTERFATLGEEALPFQILLAFRAFEALAVVVVIQSLDPTVTCLDREPAADALDSEEIIPVSFTVWQAIFKIEGFRSKDFTTVGTAETLGMELLANGIQTISLNSLVAL